MTRNRAWVSFVVSVGCASDLPDVVTDGSSTTSSAGVSSSEVGTTVDPDATTIEPATTTQDESSSSSTGLPPMCTGPDGTYGQECPEETPFCVGGMCVGCNADDELTDCASAPEAPGSVCAADGWCVACNDADASACVGDAPVCDPMTNECRACVAHDECPGDAGCHLFEGSCLPGDAVFLVDGMNAMCDGVGEPYCDISGALEAAGVGSAATIRVAPGNYIETVSITAGAVVAIVALGEVFIVGQGGFPGVEIAVNGTGYLDGVIVANLSMAPGVESVGNLRIDDSTIQAANPGLLSTAGLVYLEDVRVINNTGIGVSVGGVDLVTLRNVIIANNGSGTAPRGFVTNGPTPFSMVYTTIADNAGSSGGAINSPSGTGVVRNSIVVSSSLTQSVGPGGTIDISNSIVADDDFAGINGNMGLTMLEDLMFDANFEVQAGSIADGVAVWMTGDPPFDINGVMRPGVDGSPDAAGANLPN